MERGADRADAPARIRRLIGASAIWIALAFVSDGMTLLLLPYRLAAGGTEPPSATAVGLIGLLGLGGALAAQLVAGALLDRGGIARLTALGLAVAVTVAALAVFGVAGGLVAIALAFLLVQVSAAVVQAVQQTFVPERFAAPDRGRASGFKGAFDVGGATLAFVVLGALLAAGQPLAATAAVAGVFVACLAATVLLLPRERRARPVASRLRPDARRQFIALVAARFWFLLGTYAVGRFLLLIVADRLRLDVDAATAQTGLLLALLTLVTAVSAIAAGWLADRAGRVRVMVGGVVAASMGTLLLIGAASMPAFLALGSLVAVGTGMFMAGNWAMTSDIAAGHGAGRLMAVANLGTGGAAALAGIFGPVVDAANGWHTGAGFALLLVAASLVTLLALVHIRALAGRRLGGLAKATSP